MRQFYKKSTRPVLNSNSEPSSLNNDYLHNTFQQSTEFLRFIIRFKLLLRKISKNLTHSNNLINLRTRGELESDVRSEIKVTCQLTCDQVAECDQVVTKFWSICTSQVHP